MKTYTAQVWNRHDLITEIKGLTLDAAREATRTLRFANRSTRIMCEQEDWTECDGPAGFRAGPFAETTLVTVRS